MNKWLKQTLCPAIKSLVKSTHLDFGFHQLTKKEITDNTKKTDSCLMTD